MKRRIFVAIIVVSITFFAFLASLSLIANNLEQELFFDEILLAIILSAISITSSKYFSDTTTITTQKELKKFESDFEQKLKNLELKIEQLNNKIKEV